MNGLHRTSAGATGTSSWDRRKSIPLGGNLGGKSLYRANSIVQAPRPAILRILPASWSASFSMEAPGFRAGIRPSDLGHGVLPPLELRLKADEVLKLCQDEWKSRYLVLTAHELMLTLPGSEKISDKIPLVALAPNFWLRPHRPQTDPPLPRSTRSPTSPRCAKTRTTSFHTAASRTT